MGQRGDECWAEIWNVCGPLYRHVMTTGDSTWSADLQLLMERDGYLEETYFTFAYSPIRGESAEVLGNLITVTETTGRVLGERRLRTLRDLGALAMAAKTPEEAAQLAAETLSANDADMPFSLLYLVEDDGRHARLVSSSGGIESPATPSLIGDDARWPAGQVVASARAVVVDDLRALEPLPSGPWTDPPHTALALPLMSGETVVGVLVAAVSPRRRLDDAYRGFYDVLAGQIATILANAHAHMEERKRADALTALDRAKTEFFSNVSHEFRTPLTLMLGPLEDVLRAPDLPAAEREQLLTAQRNGVRLLKLVNTLLDFSRIEAGRAHAVYEPVDIAALTADLGGAFRSAVERAGPSPCGSIVRCGRRSSSTSCPTPSSSPSRAGSWCGSVTPASGWSSRSPTLASASAPRTCRICSSASIARARRARARTRARASGCRSSRSW